jgi:hypothetical protein
MLKAILRSWYSFGKELVPDNDPIKYFVEYIKKELDIQIILKDILPWSDEIKADHDEVQKHFIYLQATFEYVNGEPKLPENHEKIKFINFSVLKNIDIVPPTIKVLKSLHLII